MSRCRMEHVEGQVVPICLTVASRVRYLLSMKDAAEFAAMYRMWRHVVLEAADAMLQSEADARDAAQQVFVRLWESGDWRGIDDPERFFCRAGRNEALTILRRRRRRQGVLVTQARSYDLRHRMQSPEELLLRSERRDRLLQLIALLPPRCRLVCALKLVDGLTHREIADKLGISVRAVGKQVARARRHFTDLAESGELDVSLFVDGGGRAVRAST